MKFEFNLNKSESNKEKHGIDFVEAQALWNDPDLLEIPAKNVQDEDRFLLKGVETIGYFMFNIVQL